MKQSLLFLFAILTINSISIAQNTNFNMDKNFKNVYKIEISVVSSEINVTASNSDNVHVNGNISWKDPKHELSIVSEQKGNVLKIKVEYPNKFKNDNVKGLISLQVPKNIDLEINSVSGSIQVSGTGKNNIEINNVSGEIICNTIYCDLDISTVSGKINVSEVNGSVNGSTVSGNMYINKVTKNFNGSSVSGDFYLSEIKGITKTSSVSGKVR